MIDARIEMPEGVLASDDLPDGWTLTTMGSIADVIGGGTPKSSNSENFSEDGHPWITPADLSGFRELYIRRGRRDLSENGLRSCSAVVVPAGTVLMSSRAPIGYVAIAANAVCTNQGFKSFVCRSEIDPEFVYFWLRFITSHLEEMGSGSTFMEISGSRAKEIPIILAPSVEQGRIATQIRRTLPSVNSARDHLSRVPAILKRFRQAVLAAACSGRLTEDWRELNKTSEDAAHQLELMQAERREHFRIANGKRKYREPDAVLDEDLPGIPRTWCWTNFDHCSWEITVGHVGPMRDRYVAKGLPFLRCQNVRPLHFDPLGLVHIPPDFHAQLSKSKLAGGEILVVRSGANTGDCCVFPHNLAPANCSDLVITRPLSGLCPKYGAFYVSSPTGRARLSLNETGIAQPHFNVGAMRVKAFPLPPLVEQREIIGRVEALFRLADAIEERVAFASVRADKLTQSILARAFRGELVPTEAELARQEGREFEAASVLLERIKKGRNSGTNPNAKRQRKHSTGTLPR